MFFIKRSVRLADCGDEVFGDRSEQSGGEEGQRAQQQDDPGEHQAEGRRVGAEGSGSFGDGAFGDERSDDGERQEDRKVASDEHDEAGGDIPRNGVVAEPFVARAVVGCGGGEFVEHFGEPARPGIVDRLRAPGGDHGKQSGATKDEQRMRDEADCGQEHLAGFDPLAHVFRSAPDHHPGEEHRDDDVDEHIDHARTHGAEGRVEPHAGQRGEASERVEAVVHRADRAVAGRGGQHRPERTGARPETNLLAFEVACRLLDRESLEGGGGSRFVGNRPADFSEDEHEHHAEDHGGMSHAASDAPEHPDAGHRDGENRQHGDDVGEHTRVLEWMRAVGAEKSAAIGAQLLDCDERRDRPPGDSLRRALQSRGLSRTIEGHGHPADGEKNRHDKGQRQEHEEGGPLEIKEEIAESFPLARKAAGERGETRNARGGGDKLQPHECEELTEITHLRLTRVVLEVGVGRERSCGIENEIPRQRTALVGIERQPLLREQHSECEEKHQRIEDQHGDEVLLPRLRSETVGKRRFAMLHDMRHVTSERPGQRGRAAHDQNDVQNVGHNDFSFLGSGEAKRGENQVNEFDAEKRSDDASKAVEEQVATEHGGSGHGRILDAPQRERNECDDDERIENDRA